MLLVRITLNRHFRVAVIIVIPDFLVQNFRRRLRDLLTSAMLLPNAARIVLILFRRDKDRRLHRRLHAN